MRQNAAELLIKDKLSLERQYSKKHNRYINNEIVNLFTKFKHFILMKNSTCKIQKRDANL